MEEGVVELCERTRIMDVESSPIEMHYLGLVLYKYLVHYCMFKLIET